MTVIDEAAVATKRRRVDMLKSAVGEQAKRAEALVTRLKAEGKDPLSDATAFAQVDAEYKKVDALTAEREAAIAELHAMLDGVSATSQATAGVWAEQVVRAMWRTTSDGMRAAINVDPVEVPSIVEPQVIAFPEHPSRLIDVLVERRPLNDGAGFSYLQQTARENAAEPVEDLGQKPSSTFSLKLVEDRARVVAHLSEPIPERYFADVRDFERWISSEMYAGVLDGLEADIVAGDGTGEHFTGLLETVGHTAVPFAGDVLTTLRRARTALDVLHEVPNAWVLNPEDAETIDLLREDYMDTDGGAFLVGAGLGNIFGDLPRVVSTSVPAGTALLGDWRQTRLYIRQAVRVQGDRSGTNFETNAITLRAEGRFGFAVLRPQAIAVIDLADESS